MNKKTTKNIPLPTKAEISNYIAEETDGTTKRDIARAFKIKGPDRRYLKAVLKELEQEGRVTLDFDKKYRPADRLPAVLVVEIAGVDPLGDLIARPVDWNDEGAPPRILITPLKNRRSPGIGDRALARLRPGEDDEGPYYNAQIIRILEGAPQTVLGIYRGGAKGGRLIPTDRRVKREFLIPKGEERNARDGDLILAEVLPGSNKRPMGLKPAKITENLGSMDEPRAISLIAIHHHGIPHKFPQGVLREAEIIQPAGEKGRRDLRDMPFVTIDPADARDHDDAILAVPDNNPENSGGWRLWVAIADVSFYVRPGSKLDGEAEMRGNSCYFPDRVVPMLPERLSTDLCSLRAGEDRPVMVAEMVIDSGGNKLSHEFYRATIQSRAPLNYKEVQQAIDGNPSERAAPYRDTVILPLHRAWKSLMTARKSRSPLDIDVPERKVVLTDAGKVEKVERKPRYDAHRIVEEFMILANIATAEALEKKRLPCMYRVHEEPGEEKIDELRNFLKDIGFKLPKGERMRPELLNRVLEKADGTEYDQLVNDVMLRSQTQAYYSPHNQGHFGLNLARYAHFTSPIRRYADVLVHRALVRAYNLGKGGLEDTEIERFERIAEDISATERRAMAAERESTDRYLAAFLSDHVGEVFRGRISGVTRFGIFVSVEPSGADGIIPLSSLSSDFYELDAKNHRLKGRRTGKIYRLADPVDVRLKEADHITGSLRFEILGEEKGGNRRKRHHRNRGGKKGKKGRDGHKRA